MSVYNNRHGVCFHGKCRVVMEDGTMKRVDQVSKNDMVLSRGQHARVLCVTRTVCEDNKAYMVELPGGLTITPWHPVRIRGKWAFPIS
mmetsp:Transcript_6365/g.3601  ORF Transcript_6365/g.3601 Transcript_6365/m.3601 type:complete len:88 (+) Transcript_6365:1705-1968(+)